MNHGSRAMLELSMSPVILAIAVHILESIIVLRLLLASNHLGLGCYKSVDGKSMCIGV